jgi:glutamate formiminotransferase
MAANPDRKPDFGEPRIHPTAGATVVGARKPLIAYNINLNTPKSASQNRLPSAFAPLVAVFRYVKAWVCC